MKKIIITIPTHNEELIIEASIHKTLKFCLQKLQNYNWRILIADNGSTDKTLKIVKRISDKINRLSYFHIKQNGRGAALKKAWSSEYPADIYIYFDVDLATDLRYLIPMIISIEQKTYDIAIASRLKKGSKTERSVSREIMSRVYNIILKLLFNLKVQDAQCGFKAISQKTAEKIIPLIKNNNWFFDTEFLILSQLKNYKIDEIPVEWKEKRFEQRKTKVKIIKTITEDLLGLLRVKIQCLFHKY